MFNGLATLVVVGMIAIGLVIIISLYGVVDYFFLEDKYESSKPIIPEVVIKSEAINGVTKSDTTYVYRFE